MGPIEAYIVDLDRALEGSRRAKSDLLREARDGLLDAAEAHQSAGLDPEGAARRAVDDYGTIRAVAPAYQRELGSVQSARTVLLICLMLAPQDAAWDVASRFSDRGGTPPGAAFEAVSGMMSWLGASALIGCLVAAALNGAGQRFLGTFPRLTRAVGFFALAVAAVFASTATLLTVLGPHPGSVVGMTLMTGLVLAPMAVIARSGRRCLAWA